MRCCWTWLEGEWMRGWMTTVASSNHLVGRWVGGWVILTSTRVEGRHKTTHNTTKPE